MLNYSDLLHIERIRSSLWRGRAFGQASLMVGAGLSLNARPISPAANAFPTWSDLAEKIVDGLYPNHPSNETNRQNAMSQARSTSGSMRLAEEYQAAFGRDALDRLLTGAIPDLSYEPSELHSLLLRLPWSDVFTTNYDTLLERAAKGLIDRKYDVVRTPPEILDSSKPRIIKLHGSFPSNRPFIITEEDFRTYPENFAPFVNLIRQAMLESTFCLVGFSGDDPNFLNWSGWVRDNLSNYSPTIYLCGLLNLSNAKRKLLHDRNVIPVDLAPLFPATLPNRHSLSLEWFFRTLDEGRWIPNPPKWPYRNKSKPDEKSLSWGMPEIPKPAFAWYSKERLHPDNPQIPLSDDSSKNLLDEWKVTRLSYPGWLVAPAETRDRLWVATENWIHYINTNLIRLPLGRQIGLLYELNWRLETCLIPLWRDLAGQIDGVLKKINPFGGDLKIQGALDERFDDPSLKLPSVLELRRIWVDLALACLRFSRESQEDLQFSYWKSLLVTVAPLTPGLNSQVAFQECLFFLGRIDHSTTRSTVFGWNDSQNDPFWLIRQAAILVEIGEVEEAAKRAERGLRAIREGIRPGVEDLAMLSREGWAMKLVSSIKIAESRDFSLIDREFLGRWERLTESGCNPNPELKVMEERLRRPIPLGRTRSHTRFSFDLGHASTNFQSGASLLNQILPALQMIRLIEDGAYPPECGSWTLSKKSLLISVTWIKAHWPEMASSLLLRLSDSKVLEEHFDRNTISDMNDSAIVSIHQILVRSLDHGISILSSSDTLADEWVRNVARDSVILSLDFLSRILFRLPQDMLVLELKRGMSLYSSNIFTANNLLHDVLGHFLSRSISALDREVTKKYLLELISLPIPGVDGFNVQVVNRWPDPIRDLHVISFDGVKDSDPASWAKLIAWLLAAMLSKNGDTRLRASLRLTILWIKKILTDIEVEQFSTAIWSIRYSITGLPAYVSLNPRALLQLSEPEPGIALILVKKYCLTSELAPLYTSSTLPDGKIVKNFMLWTDTGEFLDEIIGLTKPKKLVSPTTDEKFIKWNKKELELIFEKVSRWWQGEGRILADERHSDMTQKQYDERYKKISSVIALVILPNCRSDYPLTNKVRDLVLEFERAGLPVLSLLPPLLPHFPDLIDDVITKIRKGLYVQDDDLSHEAIAALFSWSIHQHYPTQVRIPSDLLRDFSSLVSTRSLPGLYWALTYGRRLIESLPEIYQNIMVPSFLVGLDYLLEETKYGSKNEGSQDKFTSNSIPEFRLKSARLAYVISKTNYCTHPVIIKWLEAIEHDPIPEIRRVIETSSNEED